MSDINAKETARIIFGEEMKPCPECGSFNIKGQTPVKIESDLDIKSLLSQYAKMTMNGTDDLEGPCYLMCFDCMHKGPSIDCSGRTAADVGNDPKVWTEMKRLWNQQISKR